MEGDSKIRCLQEVSLSLHWPYRKISMAELHWLTCKWQNAFNHLCLCQSNPLVIFSYWMMIYFFSSSCLGLLGLSGFSPNLYCIRKTRTSPSAFTERAYGFHPCIQYAANLCSREKRLHRYKLLRYLGYLHRVQHVLFIVYSVILLIT